MTSKDPRKDTPPTADAGHPAAQVPLRQARELEVLAEAMRQIPNSVMIVGLDGNIVYANETLCRMTGYEKAELIGKNPRLFASGKTPRKNYQDMWAALTGGHEWWGELYNRHRSGREFIEFAHMVPLRDARGEVTGYLGIKEDITERKRMGEELDRYRLNLRQMVDERTVELVATQKELEASRAAAEAASRSKSAFLANMSHEIRTPMNAVIALTHLALQESENPKQRERLRKVATSAQHLLALINDILDFSKIEAGRMKLERIEFQLGDVIDLVAQQVDENLRAKSLAWKVDIDGRVPSLLHGDPLRLGQVLLNFVGNAVKFTSTGGVTLRVEAVGEEGDFGAQGNLRVRFSVADTGCGFDPARKHQIFNPFEQADLSTTRRHGGTGLGLAICRRIVDLMGGEMDAESVPGEGSVFWIEADFGLGDKAGHRSPAADLAHCRVLLYCEDSRQHGQIEAKLRGFGMRVQGARKIREVRTRLATAAEFGLPYDVLVRQVSPIRNETRAITELRKTLESLALEHPPVLMVALPVESVGTLQAVQLAEGFDAVLPMPIEDNVLHDALVTAVRRKTHATGAPAAAASAGRPDMRAYAASRILLVEDNPLNQDVALDMLRSAGLDADLAENGRDGVEMAARKAYDLILMDIQMPVMGGLEATQEIRRLPDYAKVPILAMTANAFAEDRQRCAEAGMNGHMAKPVTPERLYAMLREWLPVPVAVPPAPTLPTVQGAPAGEIELPDIPGLDVAAGLVAVGGRRDRYRALLEKFCKVHGDDIERIRTALAAGQVAEARRLAHGLKGVAAMIGARQLAECAFAVERPLKEALQAEQPSIGGLDAEIAILAAELDAIVGGIRGKCASGSPAGS